MGAISATLVDYHRCCDRLFAAVADPLERGDWSAAREALARFRSAVDRLLRMEEEILFPAFERETGRDQGPTRVLRFDHAQLRTLLGELDRGVERQDAAASAAARSRLSVTLHEHWAKEERVMFPQADEILAGEAGRLVDQLRCIGIE
jgi:iron-sulfur cluster repair protein YtfE (RIC family)